MKQKCNEEVTKLMEEILTSFTIKQASVVKLLLKFVLTYNSPNRALKIATKTLKSCLVEKNKDEVNINFFYNFLKNINYYNLIYFLIIIFLI